MGRKLLSVLDGDLVIPTVDKPTFRSLGGDSEMDFSRACLGGSRSVDETCGLALLCTQGKNGFGREERKQAGGDSQSLRPHFGRSACQSKKKGRSCENERHDEILIWEGRSEC